MSIRYYFGIDGGGTKTEFVLADKQGIILKDIILGTCNPNDIGIEATQKVLEQGIEEVCAGLDKSSISVFAGIAGLSVGDNGRHIDALLQKYHFGAIVKGSDAQNAVAAALGRENGIAVIMGTGSVAYAQVEGLHKRVGGYGYLFGDEGSGFAIGRDGIAAALADEDGSGAPTMLRALVHAKCGGESVWKQISDFYRGGKRLIAGYGPLVFEAFEQGDTVATSILKKNMHAVAALIEGAAKHLPEQKEITVVLCGGVTRKSDCLLPILKEQLATSERSYRIQICSNSIAYGALLLAGMKENKGEHNS